MNKKIKVISALATAILIATVVFCVVVMAQVMSKGYVSIAGYSVFRVVTGSMEPTISTGSLLLSGPADIEELEIGDIICFRSQSSHLLGQVITHRVVEIYVNDGGEKFLETRGDANTVSDGQFVTERNLVGKVVWYSGQDNIFAKIISGLSNRNGFFTFIVIPVLVITSLLLKDSMKNIHREMEKYRKLLEAERQKEAEEAEKKAGEASEQNTEKSAAEILLEQMNEEEYREMLASIKAELLEELSDSAGEKQREERAKTE